MRLAERLTRQRRDGDPPRLPRARARTGAHRRDRRLPPRQHRARAVRGQLPRDARRRGARRGRLRRPARLHAHRGLPARPAARGGAASPLPGARPRGRRLPGAPADGQRRRLRARRSSRRPCSACRRRRSRSCTGGRTSRASRPPRSRRRVGAGGPASLRGVPIPRRHPGARADRRRARRPGAVRRSSPRARGGQLVTLDARQRGRREPGGSPTRRPGRSERADRARGRGQSPDAARDRARRGRGNELVHPVRIDGARAAHGDAGRAAAARP